MIWNQINFFSDLLASRCSLNVLLPQNRPVEPGNNYHPPFRVLYLLHGYSDDQTAWQRWSSIECYVEGLNLAVIMPAVQNSFYSDMAHGGKFFTYVTEELPALVHEIFPLSTERADTFVAGLSMGGYGAFKFSSHPSGPVCCGCQSLRRLGYQRSGQCPWRSRRPVLAGEYAQ